MMQQTPDASEIVGRTRLENPFYCKLTHGYSLDQSGDHDISSFLLIGNYPGLDEKNVNSSELLQQLLEWCRPQILLLLHLPDKAAYHEPFSSSSCPCCDPDVMTGGEVTIPVL
jgi:hypothetical protein